MKSTKLPWIVKGDIDGFFGLGMDNLVQLLLIVSLLKGVLGFPDALIFGQVLPGAALSRLGVIHAFEIAPGGVISPFGWAKAPALAGGYLIMAALFAVFAIHGRAQNDHQGKPE